MEQQYGADPRLLSWICKNTRNFPQTFSDLAKIKVLDSRQGRYKENSENYHLPSWLVKREGDFSLIGEMTNLQDLRIWNVTMDDFSFISRCKKLIRLDVSETNFSDCRLLEELPNLQVVWLPLKRFLKYTEILEQLMKGLSPVKINIQEPFYRDEDYTNMKVVDGGEVTLSCDGDSHIRCVDVSFCGGDYPLWRDFPMQEEDNWTNLNDDVRQEMIDRLTDAIIHHNVESFLLSMEQWGEGHYLLADFANGWAALSYQDDENQIYYMPYNSDYDTVEILAPVEFGGQSPIAKMWALDDMELVAKIVRYFLEKGQLCPGTKWLTENT